MSLYSTAGSADRYSSHPYGMLCSEDAKARSLQPPAFSSDSYLERGPISGFALDLAVVARDHSTRWQSRSAGVAATGAVFKAHPIA